MCKPSGGGVNVDQSEGSLRTDKTGQRSGVICNGPINKILRARGQQGFTKVNFTAWG